MNKTMTEPLTDEEFEELKKEFANGDYRGFCPEGRIRSLIATIELQKSRSHRCEASEQVERLKEEVESLKEMDGNLKSLIDEFREENAKLKAELKELNHDFKISQSKRDAMRAKNAPRNVGQFHRNEGDTPDDH